MRSLVVPHRLVEMGVDACRGQVLAQPCRVGVGDLAQQQLGARPPRSRSSSPPGVRHRTAGRLPSGPLLHHRPVYCRPVTRVNATATHIPVVDHDPVAVPRGE